MSPVTGHATDVHVTPLLGLPDEPPCPTPRATAAERLRSMWPPESVQVAHSSTMVAVIVLPPYDTSTHIPQYLPWPNVPIGNAAKYGVAVFTTVSLMPDGHVPPPPP